MRSVNEKIYNIILSGIGGTGVLTTARILGITAVNQGYSVRISEIHGMAQRGGVIAVQVRIGQNIYAPTFIAGHGNLLIGFELIESVRQINKLSSHGTAIINDYMLVPSMALLRPNRYPSHRDVIKALQSYPNQVLVLDAMHLAQQAGSLITIGSVLLGAAAFTSSFPLKMSALKETMKELLTTKFLHQNLRAIDLGYTYVKTKLQ